MNAQLMALPVKFLFEVPRAKCALKLRLRYESGSLNALFLGLCELIVLGIQAAKIGATVV
jgi:hypothetical protein